MNAEDIHVLSASWLCSGVYCPRCRAFRPRTWFEPLGHVHVIVKTVTSCVGHCPLWKPAARSFFTSFHWSDIPQGASTNTRLPHAFGDRGHTQPGDTQTEQPRRAQTRQRAQRWRMADLVAEGRDASTRPCFSVLSHSTVSMDVFICACVLWKPSQGLTQQDTGKSLSIICCWGVLQLYISLLPLPPLLRNDVIWYSGRMWPTDPKMHYPTSPSPPFHFQVYISINPPLLPSWRWTNPLSQPVLIQAVSRSSIPASVQNLDVLQNVIKQRIL